MSKTVVKDLALNTHLANSFVHLHKGTYFWNVPVYGIPTPKMEFCLPRGHRGSARTVKVRLPRSRCHHRIYGARTPPCVVWEPSHAALSTWDVWGAMKRRLNRAPHGATHFDDRKICGKHMCKCGQWRFVIVGIAGTNGSQQLLKWFFCTTAERNKPFSFAHFPSQLQMRQGILCNSGRFRWGICFGYVNTSTS